MGNCITHYLLVLGGFWVIIILLGVGIIHLKKDLELALKY